MDSHTRGYIDLKWVKHEFSYEYCKKRGFYLRISSVNVATFTEKILNRKLIFLSSGVHYIHSYVKSRKFYIRRNNKKVDSTETGRIVIAQSLP